MAFASRNGASHRPRSRPEDFAMTRLILTLVAWIGLAALASASLTPRKEAGSLGENDVPLALAPKILAQAAAQAADAPYVMTDRTEVLLDGKPCKYENVPANARIVRMETAADKKTVLRIHFRSQK